ncbi:DMT family transporter [Egibacter rhizosphaerae]|uniref:DMT family transporter n=1 Tax=Egibacter rhizosphaerae TaxID=1670831 RepID=UPI0013F157A0|nr:DMT family transporter [Egibacter rhizosphaerae]
MGGARRRPLAAFLPAAVVPIGLVVGIIAVSTSAILIRLADAPALAVAFWRAALGAVALAPAAALAWSRLPRLDRRQVAQLAASGVLLAVHFALFIGSLDHTTVASATLFAVMSPLFVGIGQAVFLREPPGRRGWQGIAIALAGALVVGLDGLLAEPVAPGASRVMGDVMAFASAAAIAGYLLIGRSARVRLPVSAYASAVYGVAAVVLLPASLLTGASLGLGGLRVGGVEPFAGTGDPYTAATWWAIVAIVVGPQLLGHTVFNALLSRVPPVVVSVAVLAEPVGAGVLALLIFGEVPGWLVVAGAPLLLAGVWRATRAEAEPPEGLGSADVGST